MVKSLILAVALLIASPAFAQTQTVQVQDAWARATAAGAHTGAVYLTLTDTAGAADQLVSASSPVAGMAELHETVNDHGVMRMRPVKALPLAPGKAATLKPGGYHIMLMGLKQQLKPGDSFPLTLTFQNSPPVTATITVAKAGAMGPAMKMPGM